MAGLSRTMLNAAREPSARTDVVIVRRGLRVLHSGPGAEATIEWDRTIAVDCDARKPLQHVAMRLARHFRDSLLAGVEQDTGAALPRDPDGTPVAVNTGWMARNWLIGAAIGGPGAAQLELAPNTGDGGPAPAGGRAGGRMRVVRMLAFRTPPIRLQSLEGRSREVFEAAHAEAVAMMFPQLRTPATARTAGGTLAGMDGGG